MALQSSGAISISQISTELGSASYSLRTLSAAAGKATPDAMSEFYGYSNAPLLLDTYSTVGLAYSLRKLRSAYTGYCIRVRRSSDSTTLDVGFSGGVLDTTAVTNFVGASTGSITIWYDQSGNGYNALTYGSLVPPIIVNAGTLVTLNTKVGASFPGGGSGYGLIANALASYCPNIMTSGKYSMFAVGNINDTSTRIMVQIGGGMQTQAARRNGTTMQMIDAAGAQDTGSVNPGTAAFIANSERKASSIEIFINGASNGATAAGAAVSTNPCPLIGCYTNGASFAWNGIIQEVIFFPIDPAVTTTYRTNVNSNLATYYSII